MASPYLLFVFVVDNATTVHVRVREAVIICEKRVEVRCRGLCSIGVVLASLQEPSATTSLVRSLVHRGVEPNNSMYEKPNTLVGRHYSAVRCGVVYAGCGPFAPCLS